MTSDSGSAGSPPAKGEEPAKIGSHSRMRLAQTETKTDPGQEGARAIAAGLNTLLADIFAVNMKTKNFHWHMSGPSFRDFHPLPDEQAGKIRQTTDIIAERVRNLGVPTLRLIGDISRRQRLWDNDEENVNPLRMPEELCEDLQQTAHVRETHGVCEGCGDVAIASLHESRTREAERPVWHLFEVGCPTGG